MGQHMPEFNYRKTHIRRGGAALWVAVGIVLGVCGYWLLAPANAPHVSAGDGQKMYQCPMHPQIIQDRPGDCPICGMDLVAMDGNQSLMSPGPDGLVTVQIDTQRQQLIGLRTAIVEEASLGGEIHAPARIVTAEPKYCNVTIKTSGYIERLYADFVGKKVKKGELLFELYSPEFLTAQREYSVAAGGQKTAPDPARWNDLTEAAKRRLEYLDAPSALIEALKNGGEPVRRLQVFAPQDGVVMAKNVVEGSYVDSMGTILEIADISEVWALADLFEQDISQVRVGSQAILDVPALGGQDKGKNLKGRVVFIDPFVDPATRTLKARLEFANPLGQLRPEMLGRVIFETDSRPILTIPLDAVLDSGHRKIVFVDVSDGYFEPREIEIGRMGGGRVEVLEGLEKGEAVVTRAAFLVDSESRLQAALAELSRRIAEKTESVSNRPGHRH
jgi:Cu(I)/Ag(I) efflux system membrane fusion protein